MEGGGTVFFLINTVCPQFCQNFNEVEVKFYADDYFCILSCRNALENLIISKDNKALKL